MTRDEQIIAWCQQFSWATTTERDVYGHPPADNPVDEMYAIYDAGDDDPPMAVCAIRMDAEMICEALRMVARLG